LRPVMAALRSAALLHTGFVLALVGVDMLLLGVAVLLLPVIVLVLLLQPASRPADRAHATASPLHHLAIMPAAWPVPGGRRITRIG
jgi:hypothetical protein